MTAPALLDLLEAASFWLIVWSVCAPPLVGLAVAAYYRLRYRWGIATQQQFSRGLHL